MFNMKIRNENNNDNNIMITKSMVLMTSNVIQSILNSVHPFNAGIHVFYPGKKLG